MKKGFSMSKTVREIAIALGADASSMVKEKQRIRDEFKRQNIKPKKQGNRFVVSDKDADKVITKLKAKVEDSLNTDEESSKKNEEIRRLNSKIEGYADDFKDMLKNQQELTARSQQLEYETHEQKEKLLSTQKELDDSAEKSNQLQEKMDKLRMPLYGIVYLRDGIELRNSNFLACLFNICDK